MNARFKEVFGTALKEIREEKGLSQMELVRRSGLDRTTIPRYEAGELSPTLLNVFVLAKALDVKPSYLVEKISSSIKPGDLKKQSD